MSNGSDKKNNGGAIDQDLTLEERLTYEMRQLDMWIDQLANLTVAISKREKFNQISFFEDLFRHLILKPQRVTLYSQLSEISESINKWKEKNKKFKDNVRSQLLQKNSVLFRTISNVPYTGAIISPTLGEPTMEYELMKEEYLERSQDKLVSVILPAFNCENTIEKAVQSVLNQLYQNFELIVIDDGSTDQTAKILNEYNNNNSKVIFHSIQNAGTAHARNYGLRLAKGKYIAYLDSDNEWYPEYLLIMINRLKDFPEIDLAYCAEEVYRNDNFEKIRYKIFNRAFLENTNYIDINSVVHKRSLYSFLGGFDTRLKRLEDWDILLRYTEKKYPLCINCAMVKYNRSNHQKNPLKNLHFRKARARYRDSMDAIQKKLKGKRVQLDGMKFPSWADVQLYSNLSTVELQTTSIKIPIVILCGDNLKRIKVSVEAVRRYTPRGRYSLILLNHSSVPKIGTFLKTLETEGSDVKLVEAASADERLLKQIIESIEAYIYSGNSCVVMRNGAVVTEGWIDGMFQAMIDNVDSSVIVPRRVLPPFSKEMRKHIPFCNIENETDISISVDRNNLESVHPIDWQKGYMELASAETFCILLSKRNVGPALSKLIRGFNRGEDEIILHRCSPENPENKTTKIIYTPHSKVYDLLKCSATVFGMHGVEILTGLSFSSLLHVWKKFLDCTFRL